ncbi:MAG: hypothetical protein R3D85_13055 [Paracoccaceae bacterium]
MDHVEIAVKITQTARLDAAYLYLSAEDVARLCILLQRDPTAGRKDGNGHFRLDWRGCVAKYMMRIGPEDRITVYLMRILPKRKPPRNLTQARQAVTEIALEAIKKKVLDLLD